MASNRGLTLLEVLVSLVVIGIIATITLHLFIDQYRLAKEVAQKAEMDYSLLRSGQVVAAAVHSAQKVRWHNQTLTVSYQKAGINESDSYYLADKDGDGKLDLYQEHRAVHNPIASGLCEFSCREVSAGLWDIRLTAGSGKLEAGWERKVRQICMEGQ